MNFSGGPLDRLPGLFRHIAQKIIESVETGDVRDLCYAYRRQGEGPPAQQPWCPSCEVGPTQWRGPHPRVIATVGDTPTTDAMPMVSYGSGEAVAGVGKDEDRSTAADRLYRLADKWSCGPEPSLLVPGAVLWQGALCSACEASHRVRWLDAVWPTSGRTERALERQRFADDPWG